MYRNKMTVHTQVSSLSGGRVGLIRQRGYDKVRHDSIDLVLTAVAISLRMTNMRFGWGWRVPRHQVRTVVPKRDKQTVTTMG